ncbi:MAG: hypothetical protein ABL901_10160 [Hyphomicrobiaceae bacterium]
MGNRAVITLENDAYEQHPVALYVHWNGGLESVLAFMTFTWDTFQRGHGDMFTFHARLCQVIGNFFPDGLSLYGYDLAVAEQLSCDNGRFHFRVGSHAFELLGRANEIKGAKTHRYWQDSPNIFDTIRQAMPSKTANSSAIGSLCLSQGEIEQ